MYGLQVTAVFCLVFLINTTGEILKVQEGEEATLPCSASGTQPIIWWTSGPVNSENRVVVYDPTIGDYGYYGHLGGRRVTMDSVSGNLTIHSVQLEDEFTYYCGRGGTPVSTFLFVTVIPEKPILSPYPSKDFVPEGTELISVCVLYRVKPAASSLHWSLHGNVLKNQNDTESKDLGAGTWRQSRALQLKLTKEHHNKALSCLAAINGTIISSDFLVLKVGYGPSGSPAINPSHTEVKIGDLVSLTCDTSLIKPGSTGEHSYIWRKQNDSDIVQVTTSPTYYYQVDKMDEGGNFTCQVVNYYGQSEESSTASVSIKGVPHTKGGSTTFIIVGVVLSVTVIVLICLAIFLWRRRKSVKKESTKEKQDTDITADAGDTQC